MNSEKLIFIWKENNYKLPNYLLDNYYYAK